MVVVLVLVCSVLGLGSAAAALVLFDFSLLHAFGLWMSVGLTALIVALLPVLLPPRPEQETRQVENA